MKYNVVVTRISYAYRTLEVEAQDEATAIKIAIDKAGDYEFSESSADYAAESLTEILE
jgi:hypothetical protein